MKENGLTLNHLEIGHKAKVIQLNFHGTQRRRMLDLGFVGGTTVEALQKSPSGDPVAYYIRGAVIALRTEDAEKIVVSC